MNEGHFSLTKVIISYVVRIVVFLIGLFALALGVASMIVAGFGTATWDVLHIGLANKTSFSIGAWVQIVGFMMIIIACILERSLPKIGSLLNIFIIGYFINLILDLQLVPVFHHFIGNSFLFLVGMFLIGHGAGMYVSTKLGAGPRDGLTIILAKKTGQSIRLIRTFLEGTALLIGWLIGGPVALGTFISVFLVGPVMQASLKFWSKRIERFQKKEPALTKAAS